MACKLMFRAALRYFSDSDRSDVERWDIPVVIVEGIGDRSQIRLVIQTSKKGTYDLVNHLSTEVPPCFLSLFLSHPASRRSACLDETSPHWPSVSPGISEPSLT